MNSEEVSGALPSARAGALRAEPATQSQAEPLVPNAALFKPIFVGKYGVSEEQVRAGLRAMAGSFKANDVAAALGRQGVPTYDRSQSHATMHVAHRAADRLLQRARKAGLIYAVNNRNWKGPASGIEGEAGDPQGLHPKGESPVGNAETPKPPSE